MSALRMMMSRIKGEHGGLDALVLLFVLAFPIILAILVMLSIASFE